MGFVHSTAEDFYTAWLMNSQEIALCCYILYVQQHTLYFSDIIRAFITFQLENILKSIFITSRFQLLPEAQATFLSKQWVVKPLFCVQQGWWIKKIIDSLNTICTTMHRLQNFQISHFCIFFYSSTNQSIHSSVQQPTTNQSIQLHLD